MAIFIFHGPTQHSTKTFVSAKAKVSNNKEEAKTIEKIEKASLLVNILLIAIRYSSSPNIFEIITTIFPKTKKAPLRELE
jgi:hypothetical protein